MASENLDEFRCCLSDDRHFIIQPITLTQCGHSACKEYFEKTQLNDDNLSKYDRMLYDLQKNIQK
jgi:hypothetical protein